jgi:putative endonuclease
LDLVQISLGYSGCLIALQKNKLKTESFFVYVLKCSDDSLYTGSTNDLSKRLYQHNNLKNGAHYTKIRRPVFLVYQEELATYSEARKREGEIKSLTRSQKLELVDRKVSGD